VVGHVQVPRWVERDHRWPDGLAAGDRQDRLCHGRAADVAARRPSVSLYMWPAGRSPWVLMDGLRKAGWMCSAVLCLTWCRRVVTVIRTGTAGFVHLVNRRTMDSQGGDGGR